MMSQLDRGVGADMAPADSVGGFGFSGGIVISLCLSDSGKIRRRGRRIPRCVRRRRRQGGRVGHGDFIVCLSRVS